MRSEFRNFTLCCKSYYPGPLCNKELPDLIYHILISRLIKKVNSMTEITLFSSYLANCLISEPAFPFNWTLLIAIVWHLFVRNYWRKASSVSSYSLVDIIFFWEFVQTFQSWHVFLTFLATWKQCFWLQHTS